MKKIILALAFVVFKAMLKAASPMIRRFVVTKIEEIVDKASATENKWDDVLAEALAYIILGND